MGKMRDREIRELGGIPLSDLNLSDKKILQLARDTYWKRGEVPPNIQRIIDKMKLQKETCSKTSK